MRICLMRTVRASDFFLSSLWPVEAPFSLCLVAAKVLRKGMAARGFTAKRIEESGKIKKSRS